MLLGRETSRSSSVSPPDQVSNLLTAEMRRLRVSSRICRHPSFMNDEHFPKTWCDKHPQNMTWLTFRVMFIILHRGQKVKLRSARKVFPQVCVSHKSGFLMTPCQQDSFFCVKEVSLFLLDSLSLHVFPFSNNRFNGYVG